MSTKIFEIEEDHKRLSESFHATDLNFMAEMDVGAADIFTSIKKKKYLVKRISFRFWEFKELSGF